jgi:hypothetical protein
MQRLSRLYVSHFGSPTAWYDHLLFDLNDPETLEPTDVVFNLENAGGKTSLLAYLFSCFDPKQERWLQHLQKKSHRFAEYFARDGRPSFLVMEWKMPARAANGVDYRLIIGQCVALRESTDRGGDIERWFFAFVANEQLALDTLPAAGFSNTPVRTMHEFVHWMHDAAKHSHGDFFQTKTQDDWVKHLGNSRLLDIELLRMQVDFNSNEGGMEEGFLTFNTELELLRRFLALTLDNDKCTTVRDAVAQTADKLRSKPKYERRRDQLTKLRNAMLPFAESAARYQSAREIQQTLRRTLGGLASALVHRAETRRQSAKESLAYSQAQDNIAKTSADTIRLYQDENLAIDGLLLERKLTAATQLEKQRAQTLADVRYRMRCLEAAQAYDHLEATRARVDELQALLESEQEGLKPARQHAEIQGALLRSALKHGEEQTRAQAKRFAEQESAAKTQLTGLQQERSNVEKRLRDLASEVGQLEQFVATYQGRKAALVAQKIMSAEDRDAQSAIERLTLRLEDSKRALQALHEAEQAAQQSERSERDLAAAASINAQEAKAAMEPHRLLLAKGEALREELRQSPVLRTAADTSSPDPDAPQLLSALNRLVQDAHREIGDRNVRLVQLELDRTSILDTGVAGRSPNVDAVVRALQAAGVRSARATNTYLAEIRPEGEEARALVVSDPARFLGVCVAQAEWPAVTALAKTLHFRLSGPVKVAVSSVKPGAQVSDELVLPAQDDSAYNKPAAQTLRSDLDARISNVREERAAYEQRRDQGTSNQERLLRYLNDYGATRLNQARASIDQLGAEQDAAIERHQRHLENAKRWAEQSSDIAGRKAPLPTQIAGYESDIRRLQEFHREFEADIDKKRVRLGEVNALSGQSQGRINELEELRTELESNKETALEERLRLESEATALAQEVLKISHWDSQFPAEEQLRARPRGLETLRVTYADAVATLQTQERDRLGVLASRLDIAREESKKAAQVLNHGFSDLPRAALEPFRSMDFNVELPRQKVTVDMAVDAHHTAELAAAAAKAVNQQFWTGKKRPAIGEGIRDLADTALRERISANTRESEYLAALTSRAATEAQQAKQQAAKAEAEASQLETLHKALGAAVPLDDVDPLSVELPEEFEAFTTQTIKDFQNQERELTTTREVARTEFRSVTNCAVSREFAEVEPELSREVADSEFELAASDRVRLVELVTDRLEATKDTLAGMQPDFENCVGEIYNLTHEAIRLLVRACAITMPPTTPYVGGKPILKMKAALPSIPVETRKTSIRQYLTTLIDTGGVAAKGADLIAQTLLAISARADLGLELLKMEQNEAYQYQLASELKGSKGQGSVIAMFLYLLISQLRADMQARAKRGGGGPLILDNPFAKVQTRALVDAQRLLAKEIGVQLIFFTANADYNMLSGFRRVIRLRKAGAHNKTGRSHIEMVSAAFADPALAAEAILS